LGSTVLRRLQLQLSSAALLLLLNFSVPRNKKDIEKTTFCFPHCSVFRGVQKKVISDLKRENNFLSKELWEPV
jgi:hypothetical protein